MIGRKDLFEQINNAVLDLQASNFQTFARPLKALAKLLSNEDLANTNARLTAGIDLENFLSAAAITATGMAGSASLPWPDDELQILGLSYLLIQRFAANPKELLNFGFSYIDSGKRLDNSLHGVIRQIIMPFVRDYRTHVLSHGATKAEIIIPKSNKIFIVHGHEEAPREKVARFLEKIGFEAIILHEQASMGGTIIEKVERQRNVSFAVVLLTPDDEGRLKDGDALEPRVRQNVLLELGYFIGCLGRQNVCVLKRGHVEIPSDFAGSVWVSMDDGDGWKMGLAKELKAAGHSIDFNKVMV